MTRIRRRLGDEVVWRSQAGSYIKEKVGCVVAVIPAYARYIAELMHQLASRHGAINPGGWGWARDHESYVVLVQPTKGKGKPRLYWPIVSHLKEL